MAILKKKKLKSDLETETDAAKQKLLELRERVESMEKFISSLMKKESESPAKFSEPESKDTETSKAFKNFMMGNEESTFSVRPASGIDKYSIVVKKNDKVMFECENADAVLTFTHTPNGKNTFIASLPSIFEDEDDGGVIAQAIGDHEAMATIMSHFEKVKKGIINGLLNID